MCVDDVDQMLEKIARQRNACLRCMWVGVKQCVLNSECKQMKQKEGDEKRERAIQCDCGDVDVRGVKGKDTGAGATLLHFETHDGVLAESSYMGGS